MSLDVFCGYDRREALGFHVFVASLLEHATRPVVVRPLNAHGLPVGSNEFTFARFLVPWLNGFCGHAVFADACDMLVTADVAELAELADSQFAVQLVKHPEYSTRHPVKYLGTSMQCPNRSYARKNWTSLMLMNCAHPFWKSLTPESLARCAGLALLQLSGLRDKEIGELPDAWNRLVDEGQPVEGAKLLHWTAGMPGFRMYHDAPGAELWHAQRASMQEVA